MNAPATVGPALRRAALSLHALQVEDRDWILSALPGGQGDVLRGLLKELQDLGIPAQELLPHPRDAQPPSPLRTTLPPPSGVVARELARLLAVEPPRVRSVLLEAHPREWGSRLELPGDDGTPAGVPTADRAPALQEAVLAAVRHRLGPDADPVGSRRARLWTQFTLCFWKAGAA